MKSMVLHHEAETELREALKYYNRQRPGLGSELRQEFEAAASRACRNPLHYAATGSSGARFCPFHRFPYSLVYIDLDDHIWIVAVAHHRRRPRYWQERID